jgi:WD40 repeat protein
MLERRKNTSSLKIDIIKAFGADLDLEIKDSLFFVSENIKAIAYPVGHHIAIRDLFVREDMRKNDIMFIYNDPEVEKITSMNVSKDNSLLLVCEKRSKTSCISLYKVNKLNFNNVTIFKPKRKVISTIYSEFKYASFYVDGNYVISLGVIYNETKQTKYLQGVLWDLQIFQPFREDNYKPKCIFDISLDVTKITMENKILCTSGQSDLSFYYIYENTIKAFKQPVHNLNVANNNFIDHDWVSGKIPILITITDKNDVFILEGDHDKVNKGIIKDLDEDDSNIRITKFVIRQHISNCFNDFYKNASIVRAFNKGIVIGSLQGHLLFLEKTNHFEHMYRTIRYITREKPAKVVGLSFDSKEDNLAVAFNSNEICTIDSSNILENLKNENFEGVKFNLVCDGFHSGPITSMDIALQRPIIVTTSQTDKTVRVWNYLTGHCEYCKILLTEKENEDREMDVLAVAIHPNGYYLAVSDREMIRFFHLCYKELRFYNNDVVNNENPKANCHLLKFSYGGHLLAAVSNKTLYIIRSYTRETLKEIETPHTGTIKNIIFHDQDLYLYSIGSEGMVVEYSLFDFKM